MRYLLLLVFFFELGTAKAQRPQIFVEAGLGISNGLFIFQQQGYKDKQTGFEVYRPTYGLGVEIPASKGNSIELSLHHYVTGTILERRGTFKEYMAFNYIKMPIQYRRSVSVGKGRETVFLTVGPYLAYMYKGIMTSQGLPYRVDKKPYDLFQKFDFGLGASVGYQTPMALYFRGSFTRGLSNLSHTSGTSTIYDFALYNRVAFAFSAGFNF